MKPILQSIKSNTFLFVLVIFLFSACSDNEEVFPYGLSEYDYSVLEYFKEVALGFEIGSSTEVTRRWEEDMKIFIGGNNSQELLSELDKVVSEINELTSTGFEVKIVVDTLESNYYLHFGSAESFGSLFPSSLTLAETNYGLFYVSFDSSNQLNKGRMYVDVYRSSPVEQLHLLREELTQSLGLAKDSDLYPESIFQQDFSTKTTEYSQIDKDLIRLLYHKDMIVGADEAEIEIVLKDILLTE